MSLFENPELSAMAAIGRILEDLPDDAARLRVMRWAFGKYSEEFKRPVDAAFAAATPPPAPPAPRAAVPAPTQPVSSPPVAPPPPPAPITRAHAEPVASFRAPTPEPALVPETAPGSEPADFDRQVAELNDLFADRPDGLRLAKPRQR